MADNRSIEKRSKNMAAIASKDTKPEVFLRSLLFNDGYRFRKNCKKMTGHPDIWMRKYNTVIFVNGCFWHMHKNCKYSGIPKSRSQYWKEKFDYNVSRDIKTQNEYRERGIKCLIVWECAIKKAKKEKSSDKLLLEIKEFLESEELFKEIGE